MGIRWNRLGGAIPTNTTRYVFGAKITKNNFRILSLSGAMVYLLDNIYLYISDCTYKNNIWARLIQNASNFLPSLSVSFLRNKV